MLNEDNGRGAEIHIDVHEHAVFDVTGSPGWPNRKVQHIASLFSRRSSANDLS